MIRTTPATPSRLEYEIDYTNFATQGAARSLPVREFQQRGKGEFRPGELVKVITKGDYDVCPVCQEIAAGSPYTIEEAQNLLPHGGPIGAHNCRCKIVPFQVKRALSVETSRRLPGAKAGPVVDERVTLRQLAERVASEMGGSLRIKVR